MAFLHRVKIAPVFTLAPAMKLILERSVKRFLVHRCYKHYILWLYNLYIVFFLIIQAAKPGRQCWFPGKIGVYDK